MFSIRTVFLIALLLSCITAFSQQDSAESTEGEAISTGIQQVDDTWLAPVVSDEMTNNPEQNRQWRLGQSKYPARPKDVWEIGLHGGHFFIDGDVDPTQPAGFGIGGHLRKSLNYITSIRFDAFYGQAKGLEPQPWRHRSVGGGLLERNDEFQGWEPYDVSVGGANSWFPSYKTQYFYGAAQLVFNIGNILFHQDRNKWNTYVALGVGLDHNRTMLDLLDANGQAYTDLDAITAEYDFNTKNGRELIEGVLRSRYDNEYETEAFKKEGIFRISDKYNIHALFTASVGVSRKINKRFNIGIEHQMMMTDNDYLDGILFRTANDASNNVDIGHYTNLRFGFNVGSFAKRTEPLYWQNPMGPVYNDIAELKARPYLKLDDGDGDGVIDLLDQEPETPEGCLVDTKGVTLDSDGDGVVDCKDKEPFSPPGYPVDADGVAQVEDVPMLTEEDVITIIKNNCDLCANRGYGQVAPGQNGNVASYSGSNPNGTDATSGTGSSTNSGSVNGGTNTSGGTATGGGSMTSNGNSNNPINNTYGTIVNTSCGNWFLPMLHYDLDKYGIRPESYPKLHQIATVMKNCPSMCVTAHGHTDVRSSNRYNRVLSYNRAKTAVDYMVANYGIDRSRFKIMYGGEESPLIPNLRDNHFTSDDEELMQFINRRVEFRVCNPEDVDMARPDGPNAGQGSTGSSRPGSKYKYKGYKNSGY